MNTCLGMAKSQPLVAASDRYLSFGEEESRERGALLLADLEASPPQLGEKFPLWSAYAQTLPAALVVERRVMRNADTDDRLRRLPIVRLRQIHLLGDALRLEREEPEHCARLAAQVGGGANNDKPPNGWIESMIRNCFLPLLGGWEHALDAITSPTYVAAWRPLVLRLAVHSQAWGGLTPDWIAAATTTNNDAKLMRCALWRVAVAHWIGHHLLPSRVYPRGVGGCTYQAQLFIDTHLAFFAAAYKYQRLDDGFFLQEQRWSRVYPLPYRVCCAEELPDLCPYLIPADLAFDSGRGKKQHTQLQAVIHIFLCKMMNNICHIRHLHLAIKDSTRAFPIVRDLFVLVARTTLLGNTPEATSRLALPARIRVQVDFVRDPLAPPGEPLPADTIADRLVKWTRERKYVSHFFLREFFIYTVRADVVVDRYLERRQEWREYKRVVSYANQLARDEMSRQCIEDVCRERFEWALLDARDKGELKAAYLRLGGRAPSQSISASRNAHAHALSACQKISKGRVEHLLPKKMVPNEMAILRYHADRRLTVPSHPLTRHFDQARRAHDFALVNIAIRTHDKKRLLFTRLPSHIIERIVAFRLPLDPSVNDPIPPIVDNAALEQRIRENDTLPANQLARQLPLVDVIRRHVVETEVLPPIQREVEALAPIFHVATWAAARDLNEELRAYVLDDDVRRPPVVRLRYLAWLGFAPEELAYVRKWVYEYSIRDVADNKFKRQTCTFGYNYLAAFLKLKHYFRLVDKYRDEDRVMLLSAEMTKDTYNVLRRRLSLADHEATPPLAGKAVLCGGCNHWATPVKPAPVWIECRNDPSLLAERVHKLEAQQKANDGRAWRLDEYLHAPVELGSWEGWTALSGEPCCRYGKYPKEVLTAERDRARQAKLLLQHYDDDDNDSDSDDERRGAPRESEAYLADRMYLELIEPSAAAAAPTAGGGQINPATLLRLPNRFGRNVRSAAAATSTPSEPPSQKKKNSATRAETTRILRRVMQPVFRPGPRLQCRHDPMLTVDMVGIWFSYGGSDLFGLCVYCGDLTTVRNEKIMTRGLSCMNHPHAGAFPLDHHQTLATMPLSPGAAAAASSSRARDARANLNTTRAQRQMARQASPVMDMKERLMSRHPLVLDATRPCMYCRQFLTRSLIRVVDVLLQTAEMALCDACLGALRAYGPTQTIGYRGARAAEPIALEVVLRELERTSGQRRRRKQQQRRGRKHAGGGGGDDQNAQFLAKARATTDGDELLRLVREHPHFTALLSNDGEANAAYYLYGQHGQISALRDIAEKLIVAATAAVFNQQ